MLYRRRALGLLNRQLERRLDLRLVRPDRRRIPVRSPARPQDRLLGDPVFLLSSVRSGSTLLRVILDSHSQIHAPVETHFRRLAVVANKDPVRQALAELDLNERDLDHLLWDRLLHRQLAISGKQVLIEKTPSNVFVADRLRIAWPDSRFVFLLRHPFSIAQSWHEGDPARRPMERAVSHTLNYMEHLQRARKRHSGLTVRYEDLTSDPAGQTRRLCDYVEVPWEPGMLTYGNRQAEFVKGIGDWQSKIRTGTVQPGRPLPEPAEVPEALRSIATTWGY